MCLYHITQCPSRHRGSHQLQRQLFSREVQGRTAILRCYTWLHSIDLRNGTSVLCPHLVIRHGTLSYEEEAKICGTGGGAARGCTACWRTVEAKRWMVTKVARERVTLTVTDSEEDENNDFESERPQQKRLLRAAREVSTGVNLSEENEDADVPSDDGDPGRRLRNRRKRKVDYAGSFKVGSSSDEDEEPQRGKSGFTSLDTSYSVGNSIGDGSNNGESTAEEEKVAVVGVDADTDMDMYAGASARYSPDLSQARTNRSRSSKPMLLPLENPQETQQAVKSDQTSNSPETVEASDAYLSLQRRKEQIQMGMAMRQSMDDQRALMDQVSSCCTSPRNRTRPHKRVKRAHVKQVITPKVRESSISPKEEISSPVEYVQRAFQELEKSVSSSTVPAADDESGEQEMISAVKDGSYKDGLAQYLETETAKASPRDISVPLPPNGASSPDPKQPSPVAGDAAAAAAASSSLAAQNDLLRDNAKRLRADKAALLDRLAELLRETAAASAREAELTQQVMQLDLKLQSVEKCASDPSA